MYQQKHAHIDLNDPAYLKRLRITEEYKCGKLISAGEYVKRSGSIENSIHTAES
jgi:hypothetical protein